MKSIQWFQGFPTVQLPLKSNLEEQVNETPVENELTLTTVGKNFTRRHFKIFFMQDNLDEMLNSVFWEK